MFQGNLVSLSGCCACVSACLLALFQMVVVQLEHECLEKVSRVLQQLLHEGGSSYYINFQQHKLFYNLRNRSTVDFHS